MKNITAKEDGKNKNLIKYLKCTTSTNIMVSKKTLQQKILNYIFQFNNKVAQVSSKKL